MNAFPDDINDYLIENSIKLQDGAVVVPLWAIREALEHYYYAESDLKGVFSHENTTNSKIFNGAYKTPRRGKE